LYCKAMTAPDLDELREFVFKPKERVVYFERGPFFPPPSRYVELCEKYPDALVAMDKRVAECMTICDELGPWCADRAIELAIEDLERQTTNELLKRANERKPFGGNEPDDDDATMDVDDQESLLRASKSSEIEAPVTIVLGDY
jgi:hypothetical protein